jgi:predicted ATPase
LLHHVKGELLLAQNPSDGPKAEPCFRTAIEIARRQSARPEELRATTSLALLLATQCRRDEARTLLAETYRWFTEGFDTLDLKNAKALLDELNEWPRLFGRLELSGFSSRISTQVRCRIVFRILLSAVSGSR